jgi:hypothetical protein
MIMPISGTAPIAHDPEGLATQQAARVMLPGAQRSRGCLKPLYGSFPVIALIDLRHGGLARELCETKGTQ